MSESRRRSRGEVRQEALELLGIPVERRRTPPMYRLSLLLVSALIVALPLVYVAIVAGAGWGLYWYAQAGGEMFADIESTRGYVLARFGPLVVGGLLFVFLLKPLLARAPKRQKPYTLRPENEPYLFEFIRALARRLNAPMPSRIDVDLDVNASASFAAGLTSLIDGRLALTIGLPLTSCLRLRELTAVLAHEFGHFSQGAGMRFYYLTNTVNHWFARVVFKRDSWDEFLQRTAGGGWWLGSLVLHVARGCIWLSRQLLYGLLVVASKASALMSRQMEFDADQNAVHLCGSESFAQGMRLLPQIAVAHDWAHGANNQSFREGQLADDLPVLVRQQLAGMDADVKRQVVANAMETTVDMYATHPPTQERIARAEELDREGTFVLDAPSWVLFEDYPALSRDLTLALYETALGGELDEDIVVSAQDVHSKDQERARSYERVQEYFLGRALGVSTFALEPLAPSAPERPKRALERLTNLRHELVELVEQLGPDTYPELILRSARARAAEALLTRRLEVVDSVYQGQPKAAVVGSAQATDAALERARGALAPLATVQRNRLSTALDLLCVPEVRARVAGADELEQRALRAVEVFAGLSATSKAMFELAGRLNTVQAVLQQVEGQDEDLVDNLLSAQARKLQGHLLAARAAAEDLRYPYESARGPQSIADFLVGAVPEQKSDLDQQGGAAQRALQDWAMLLQRLHGDLAEAVLAVEQAVQLPALAVEATES